MKGNISLGDFIRGVKAELVQAANDRKDDPFFALTDVELEASFSLEAEGEVGFKFVVAAKGATTASQVHKVTMKFKPISPKATDEKAVQTRGEFFTIPIEDVSVVPGGPFVTIPFSSISGKPAKPGIVEFGSLPNVATELTFDFPLVPLSTMIKK